MTHSKSINYAGFISNGKYWLLGSLSFVVVSLSIEFSFAQGAHDGETIYLSRCSSCHQANGEGITGVFPSLNGVDWVTGDKGRLIRITLDGVMGELRVGNVVYNGAMPPWKSYLSDEEMASLLTYIRSAWENDASAITAYEVQQVRTVTNGRKQAWTAEELEQEANQGISGAGQSASSATDSTASN